MMFIRVGIAIALLAITSIPLKNRSNLPGGLLSDHEKQLTIGGDECANTTCQIECSSTTAECQGSQLENNPCGAAGVGERCAGNSSGSGSGNVYTTVRQDGTKAVLGTTQTTCTPEWVCRCQEQAGSLGIKACTKVQNPGEQTGNGSCTSSGCDGE